MTTNGQAERWLTTGQVARRLGWSADTIRRRCETGDIPGGKLPGGTEWRIPAEWVDRMLRELPGGTRGPRK